MKKRHEELVVKRTRAGLGLITKKDIKKGADVIEYTGEKISEEEANRRFNRYLFELNDRWTIDGSGRDNLARYINHSCRPNCEAELNASETRIFIKARRAIKAGEELTYNYGKAHFNEYIKPHGCRCEKCEEERKQRG